MGLETEAVQRINAYADVGAIVGERWTEPHVTGSPTLAAVDGHLGRAMRAGQQIVPLATPGKDISSYEVTPGMIRMIAGSAKSDVSGVGIYRRGKDFGLTKGSVMQTEQGTMSVAGVFYWPNDGRDTRFAYASLCPSASNGTFDECWVRQWPQSGQTEDVLFSTLVASGSSSNAGVTQVNKSFDSHYDAQASYGQRMTRWMPWLGLAVGLMFGAFGVRRRRLEYAGALHSGQSKGAQLLEIAVETLIWSGLACASSAALLGAYCVRMSIADSMTVWLGAMRAPCAIFAGVMVSSVLVGMTIHETQLFRFFSNARHR
ncbi:MAG: hypothetical protein ACLS6O_03590 [Bifidobacterium sp.]